MERNIYQRNKRKNESENNDEPRKRHVEHVNIDDDGLDKIYTFRVLLPNGSTVGLKFREPENEMPIEEFIDAVKQEYFRDMRQTKSPMPKRRINWKSGDLCFVDPWENMIKNRVDFQKFKPNKSYIIRLCDGSSQAEIFENMWDLTPETELLMELPEEYTYETALADLIDNSLQAVWSNGVKERRFISVEIEDNKISIFDTGPGMDGSDENCIVKWGKMGASLHRLSRGQAIGGKPPYLMPFFGMFGYGGPIASMHLGRHVLVSSKTKESEKVYVLRLEREALLNSSGFEQTWRTDGGIRDPTDDEIQKSPHGTYTKVEIFEPKMKRLDTLQLRCKLKDVYFPYIQCDEVSGTGKTIRPIEFQVNGIDLAEIDGGEIAITNLHSCNGPEFVVQLHFHFSKDILANSPGLTASKEANARLKFVYFPVVEGIECIEKILKKLNTEGYGVTENFDTFSRVSIRRLGRLLPKARWPRLPFMEPKQKKGDKAQILKRCFLRVKCFVETDAGFKPTPSKTDLAHYHLFTTALKNFGSKSLENDKEVNIEIYRDGKPLTLSQVERQYQEWIYKMHECYDEEIECGADPPLHIVSPSNKKALGISSNVVRVHKVIWRKGTSWKAGQTIKILKGACAGCHKNNVYATLEYILLEGFQGDAGGEARLVCRPLGVSNENGSFLALSDGNASIDIRGSMSLPISVIDSGKCLAVETAEWNDQLEKQRQKMPSAIDILSVKHCQELGIEGGLPIEGTVYAGHIPHKEIVAVIRPASFISASTSENLDQKYVLKENFEMSIEIKFRGEEMNLQDQHIYSGRISPSSCKGFHGLYIFSLQLKCPKIFQKAGVYTFAFSIRELSIQSFRKRVLVKASSEVGRWGVLGKEQSLQFCVRVGSCFPAFGMACYDKYDNPIPFASVPDLTVKLCSKESVIAIVHKMKLDLSFDKSALNFKDVLIESNELDRIQPSYEANLVISPKHELFSVSIPCKVIPGFLQCVTLQPENLQTQLLPGHVIQEFMLEMCDAYGNHVERGTEVVIEVDGFCFQDQRGSTRKVDDFGHLDLSSILKVTSGYGKKLSIFIVSDKKIVFRKDFQTEKRELRVASEIPEFCVAGSQLEDIVFEVTNSEGDLDKTIHDEQKYGQPHTLTITSESMDTNDSVQYSFRNGRCMVRAIPVPQTEGAFCLVVAHSRHPELQLTIKVHVEQAPEVEHKTVQPQSSSGKMVLFEDLPSLKACKVENDDVYHECSDRKILPFHNTYAPKDVENLLWSIINDHKELEDDVYNYGLRVADHEKTLNKLKDRRVIIEQDLKLQGGFTDKVLVLEWIESKGGLAAAVISRLLGEIPLEEQQNHFTEDVLGVVALLATVQTNELSRILAEYLGEDQMLAVVCKSFATADDLKIHAQNRNVDHALHALATALGKSVNDHYLVICLEDIRPYTGEVSSDPQRKLALPDPTLLTGNTPPGYLGHAVNMIDIDVNQLCIRTAAGHGLRETLFYRLFGELQVYETRENMIMAKACIEHGAVSLDGGILRGNGVVSFGYRELDVCFPVNTPRTQSSSRSIEMLKQIREKKLELIQTDSEIEKETRIYGKTLKRLFKKQQRYTEFLEKKGELLGLAHSYI